ncbi:MBL fold metallo-hydrolase [Halovulum dunhuangense]|uniref:MBL fold metallo-hydrolase n=1 Tax=Halovulum dunhuangense TaxID=1505036 RepID=A0A849L2F8_9RHOB|nr:MBL fold metallo-hydrolase [Halovulum dunhuangense]NNU80391.1 MBL fold metallo-hydrolase [Halovulum dunhuangense]
MAELVVRILGCGSSGGVPRLGGHWGACDPKNPRNRRTRCSILLEKRSGDAVTRVLVDTSPDLRAQLLDADVGLLDGVVFTHAHADHTHGLDDLRMIVFNRRARLPVWADAPTAQALMERFGYAFVQPDWSSYPPILDLNPIDGPFEVDGPAGPIPFHPFRVAHGGIDALGFRIHDLAYLPDVSDMPEEHWPLLENLDCWILDALRYTPHPTHIHLEKALDWIDRARPARAVLTNMHVDLDYATLEGETPPHVTPAHDGLTLRLALK